MKHEVITSDCCQSSVTVCDITVAGYEYECDSCGQPCEVQLETDPYYFDEVRADDERREKKETSL